MRLQNVWMIAIMAMVALSGCASEPVEKAESEDDVFNDFDDLEATDETGVIRGVVVDDAIVPIPNVKISVLNTAMNTTSNVEGAFGFAGLEPGSYILVAEHPDFIAVQQGVSVVAGLDKPDIQKVRMERNPSTLPYVEVIQQNGFIACSFTSPSVSVAACGVGPLGELTENAFINYVTYDATPDHIQSEMLWDPTSLLGESMSLSWTDPADGAQKRINASSGPSPLVVSVDRPLFEEMNLTGKELWLRVFSTQMEGSDHIDEGAWNDPYNNQNGYDTWNNTAPAEVKDAMEQNVFGVRTLSPFGEDCIKYPVLFDACYGAGGAGASIQQEYEIFNAAFFNFLPEEAWMFSEDGVPEAPDA